MWVFFLSQTAFLIKNMKYDDRYSRNTLPLAKKAFDRLQNPTYTDPSVFLGGGGLGGCWAVFYSLN